MIEGLSCGLNVLCSNLGGTRELVKDNGVVLDVDKPWEGKYLSSSVRLDRLKKDVVSDGIKRLMSIKTRPDVSEFDMSKVAKKYVKIIKKCL